MRNAHFAIISRSRYRVCVICGRTRSARRNASLSYLLPRRLHPSPFRWPYGSEYASQSHGRRHRRCCGYSIRTTVGNGSPGAISDADMVHARVLSPWPGSSVFRRSSHFLHGDRCRWPTGHWHVYRNTSYKKSLNEKYNSNWNDTSDRRSKDQKKNIFAGLRGHVNARSRRYPNSPCPWPDHS